MYILESLNTSKNIHCARNNTGGIYMTNIDIYEYTYYTYQIVPF